MATKKASSKGSTRSSKSAAAKSTGSTSAKSTRSASAKGGRSAAAKSSRGSSSASGKSGGARGNYTSHPLVEHEEIRQWAEDRGATPSCVKGTGKRGDTGMIRLDFPGYSGEESLQEISWDDWFEKFDANNLALMVQDTTARGEQSNFNKLVKRTTAQQKPRVKTAR